MKTLKHVLIAIAVLCTFATYAQIEKPAQWNFSSEKISDNEYQVLFKAKIGNGWHLFSQYLPKGNYSLPTTFTFEQITDIELVDTVAELSNLIIEKDEMVGAMVHFYLNEAIFAQKVKVTGPAPTIGGKIDFQCCTDEQCVMGNEEFLVQIGSKQPTVAQKSTEENVSDQTKAIIRTANSNSIWKVIIEAMLWGLVALLTPCVFPMVPMTVSFFIKNGNSRKRSKSMAATFGLSIIALYTIPIALIITATYLIGGQSVTADIFNWLSTHWLPNVLFFLIFMTFALSFFGAFEIVMPNSLINKSDSKADKGGLYGCIFMALTLVLVSFSCTGPIVGTIIVKSTQGDIWEPIITMLAFSVAFAAPFTLLAFFPSWLNKLPKSGSWLNSVKIVLGFVEIALGLKFLSVADQTYHWGILDREVYLAIWISVFTMLGMYLTGKLHIKGDEQKPIGSVRLLLGIVTFAFVVYLIPGMWGAPLKVLSGYLPPQTTMDFNLSTTPAKAKDNQATLCEAPKYSNLLCLPHGLSGYFDYEQAIKCAKAQNKPLFIDFTGHGCVNCREMESRVWSDSDVLKILNNDYIVVALYVDDKTLLPESEWITSAYDGKVKKSLGKKNADLQISRFNTNAQPYYCLLDTEGNLLTDPMGYNLNTAEFVEFLENGIKRYQSITE